MVLVDQCSVEFFVNRGDVAMTCTVFPASKEQHLWLRTVNGAAAINELSIAEIKLD